MFLSFSVYCIQPYKLAFFLCVKLINVDYFLLSNRTSFSRAQDGILVKIMVLFVFG